MTIKLLAISFLIFANTACSTTPIARQARFNVEWVRSTLLKENYTFRHSERTAPLIDGNILYQGNGIDGLAALDRHFGHTIWRFNVKNGIESGLELSGELLYFGGSDGQFYAINKNSGKAVWTFPTRIENLAAPLVHEGYVYFLAGNNVLYALDAKTGKQLWVYNRGDVSSLSIRGGAKPVQYKGTLYIGFADGYLAAINSRDGSLVWERKLSNNLKFVDVDSTAVVDEQSIWVSSYDGALFSLSRTDGQVQWRMEDGGAVPVTIDGENLYYSSLSQNVYALNKNTGVQKWKFAFEEKNGIPTQPVLHRGLVIVAASDGDVMALSELSGKLVAKYRPGAGVFATPALDPKTGQLYVYSNQANVHLLKIVWHRPQDDWEWK
ncbi:MAG: PQQ-binding-like beta-propeller repeat protein [Oligoflexia bacterium]|nr:PQQ-binding-like beta-propeller repeat protein [Oligoflexia bacterium]